MNKVIGEAHPRIDGRLKVTGAARYSGDNTIPNLAFGYLLKSTIASGNIRSIDTAEADSAPGVVAIFTPFRPLKLYSGLDRTDGAISGDGSPPLQNKRVQYYGETIGLVVADSFEQARDAAALVRVLYDEKTPAASLTDGMDKAFAPDKVDQEKAVAEVLAPGVNSIDQALEVSKITVSARYSLPINHHNPMEPHATVALWEDDRLTIYDATQYVIGQRSNLAEVLGIDEDKVRVLCPFVGGAFGCKGAMWMHSPLTAAAARAIGRPVKTILTREQMYTSNGYRPALLQDIALGANEDGTLQAVKHEVTSVDAKSKTFIEAAAHRTSRFLYKSPNIQVSHKLVPLDIPPATFMRAPGEAPGMFALESAMDELAAKLGMDPIELRIKNYADIYPGRNIPWSAKNLDDCYKIGADRFGWSKRNSKPGENRDGVWLIGHGMATSLYPAYRSRSSAKVRLHADGTALVSASTQDLGTGTWTVLAIVGAEMLGLPIEKVKVELGDSSLPPAPVSGGSQSVASVTPAIKAASEAVKRKLVQVAIQEKKSPFAGLKPEQVSYENGRLTAEGHTIAFGEMLSSIGRGAVEAMESTEPGEEERKFAFHSFGSQFCELKVNRWTGEVRVLRMTSVMDIGTVINATAARSQIMGGMVFGIGMALLEGSQLEAKNGRFANANIAEYLVPTNADVPAMDIHFLDRPDLVFNPIGARGIGEIGITGTPAAIGNAVFNATGVRVRDFPIYPERLIIPIADGTRVS
jgi:xanthine dehydrogenase YagR molybdenum-binding subunit